MDLIRRIVDGKPRSKSPSKRRSASPTKREHTIVTVPGGPYASLSRPEQNGYPSSYSYHPQQHTPFTPGAPMGYNPNGATSMLYPPPMEYPPVCYLPLPPSPFPVSRNNSRNSNVSADSVNTWNTEKNCEESFFLNGRNRTPTSPPDPKIFDDPLNNPLMRTRSHSPQKKHQQPVDVKTSSRSKSPQKKKTVNSTLDYLNSQCHLEGCSATIVVQSTRFHVCKHQLSHASEYFRKLFASDSARQPEINVIVSEMSVPSPSTQFRWFFESSVPCPGLKDISDDTLETCMRLSKRFEAAGLESRCAKYIHHNAHSKQPIVVLCWLNWCLKHRLDVTVQHSCLPVVARLPLTSLEQHRHMLTERIYADLLAAKLRACYDKAVSVFQTIHNMDHFVCELPQCPRCGRMRENMKVRVLANPCRKMIGCERCMRDFGCEIEAKAQGELQAYYQCPHALLPLNDCTEDCHCQTSVLSRHLRTSTTSSSDRGRSKQKRERLISERSHKS